MRNREYLADNERALAIFLDSAPPHLETFLKYGGTMNQVLEIAAKPFREMNKSTSRKCPTGSS